MIQQSSSCHYRNLHVITGVTGQTGSYMLDLLLEREEKCLIVCPVRSKNFNKENIKHALGPRAKKNKVIFPVVDIAASNFTDVVMKEIYAEAKTVNFKANVGVFHFAAFSHVGDSYKHIEEVMRTNIHGTFNVLNLAKRLEKIFDKVVMYHAATSELFSGDPSTSPQSESTVFEPRSPYAISKYAAYYVLEHERRLLHKESRLFILQGISFNHESSRRHESFVTKKIASWVAAHALDVQDHEVISLGNVKAKRDWSHAYDIVQAIWRWFLRADEPGMPTTLIFGSGETRSVEEFLAAALSEKLKRAVSLDEVAQWYRIDSQFVRKSEVWELCADPSKARALEIWKPSYSFVSLVQEMVRLA